MTARIKISELPAATAPLAGTEGVPLVQAGVTRRVTAQAIADLSGAGRLNVGAQRVTDFTLALADDDFLPVGAAGAIVVTVPADSAVAFPVGTQKTIQRTDTGAVSIAAAGGVTVTRPGGTDATARGTGSVITLVKTGADAWALAGDLTPTAASAAAGAVTTSGLTMATARLLGRTTASTGDVEEISVSGASLSGGVLTIPSYVPAYVALGSDFTHNAFSWSNVTGMTLPIGANEVWKIEVWGHFQSAATNSGMGVNLTFPTGANFFGIGRARAQGAGFDSFAEARISDVTAAVWTTAVVTDANVNMPVYAQVVVRNGSTAGDAQLQIASQNTTVQTLKAGAVMFGIRLA